MPLMLVFGSVSLSFQYLSYKYLFLTYSRKPPTFDEQLHRKAMAALPFSVILHLLIGIYAYGSDIFFPTHTTDSIKFSYSYVNFDTSELPSGTFSEIISRYARTPWLTALAALIIVYYICVTVLWVPL